MDYPLRVRIYKADYSSQNPNSKAEQHIVKARYNNGKFKIIDPYTESESGVYNSIEDGLALHDTDEFFWAGEVLVGDDPRM